jgi:hypothetical protein
VLLKDSTAAQHLRTLNGKKMKITWSISTHVRTAVAQFIEALRYQQGGSGFDFLLT